MIEKPIIFSTPMVRAILDGRKTQTRRIIKPQPLAERFSAFVGGYDNIPKLARFWTPDKSGNQNPLIEDIKCPYGQIGDILWVRETWRDDGFGIWSYKADDISSTSPWTSPIFMPKYACRIKLEITDIRVERLHDISEDDAKAEGVPNADSFKGIGVDDSMANRYAYRELWDLINGKGAWNTNSWVWVLEFKRLSTKIVIIVAKSHCK